MAQSEIARLYGLPLERFTPARDELARRLRRDGDRATADEVKQLRKPTVASWALNQLQRHDPGAVQALIDAGEHLRDAQQELLAQGARAPLREAAARERTLVDRLAASAGRVLTDAGHAAGPATQSKVSATLHATATDPEARELLAQGALVRDYEASDLGLAAVAADAPAGTPARATAQSPPPRVRDAAAERKARRIEQQLERAQADRLELEQNLDEAQRASRAASDEASRANTALERAEAQLERAATRAEQAAKRVSELEAALAELRP
jgi:hypothetical protein